MDLMRKTWVAGLALLICTVSVQAETPVNKGLLTKVAIEGYDPVAYFEANSAVEGRKEFQFEWNGAKWRFSSAENLEKFRENPERYAPQYGGFCAWAMANGYKAKVDPKAFTIWEGRLYLNYSTEVEAKWRADIPGFVGKGDAEWEKLLE